MKNIFKIASLLTAAVMLFACELITPGGTNTDDPNSPNSGELKIFSDKDVIQANGKDACTITVMLGDKDVTAESKLFNEFDEEIGLVGGFTTTKVGEHKLYAEYGTLSTYKKNDSDSWLVIKAIDVQVPESAIDPQPGNLKFVHRAFLTQYTGTGCGYCPLMIKVLKELMADKVIPNKAVHAAVHSYGAGDPAYIAAPKVSNYPYLTVDLVLGFSADQGASMLTNLVEQHTADEAKAGISVSPLYYKDKGTLVVKVAVKAAVDGIFNVGAWLLEDEIYGQQSDYMGVADESFNTHENCVRIADSRYSTTWFGHYLGELKAGQVAEKTFVMDVKSNWKEENLHLAVFTSYGQVEGKNVVYTVCNAVDASISTPTPFEYAK